MAGDRRLERMQRLVRVQEQMLRAAELDLAATRERASALEADRAALLGSLAGGAFGHLLLEAANRRLRNLASEATELDAQAARQAEALRERGLAGKRAEAMQERLAEAHRREAERREGLDRLDGIAQARPGDASLP